MSYFDIGRKIFPSEWVAHLNDEQAHRLSEIIEEKEEAEEQGEEWPILKELGLVMDVTAITLNQVLKEIVARYDLTLNELRDALKAKNPEGFIQGQSIDEFCEKLLPEQVNVEVEDLFKNYSWLNTGSDNGDDHVLKAFDEDRNCKQLLSQLLILLALLKALDCISILMEFPIQDFSKGISEWPGNVKTRHFIRYFKSINKFMWHGLREIVQKPEMNFSELQEKQVYHQQMVDTVIKVGVEQKGILEILLDGLVKIAGLVNFKFVILLFIEMNTLFAYHLTQQLALSMPQALSFITLFNMLACACVSRCFDEIVPLVKETWAMFISSVSSTIHRHNFFWPEREIKWETDPKLHQTCWDIEDLTTPEYFKI